MFFLFIFFRILWKFKRTALMWHRNLLLMYPHSFKKNLNKKLLTSNFCAPQRPQVSQKVPNMCTAISHKASKASSWFQLRLMCARLIRTKKICRSILVAIRWDDCKNEMQIYYLYLSLSFSNCGSFLFCVDYEFLGKAFVWRGSQSINSVWIWFFF